MVTGFHATGAGNLGVQPAIEDFVFDVGQKVCRTLFVANAFGIAAGTETGADKNVVFRFFHL
jgi:hypothetical protein